MMAKVFSKLLMLFALESVMAIKQSDIYDIKQITRFQFNMSVTLLFGHPDTTSSNDTDEQNKSLKVTSQSMAEVLKELNMIASDQEDNYWSNNFYKFIKQVEEHQLKKGYSGSFFKLDQYLRKIERKRATIDSVVRTITNLHYQRYFEKDVVNYCPFFVEYLRSALHSISEPSIASSLEDFLRALITKMPFEDQHNFCGKASSLSIELFNFYRLAIIPFFKKHVMDKFARALELQCQNQTSSEIFYDELTTSSTSTLELTKKLLKDALHYTYRCDIKYFDEDKKDSYYFEMDKMIQSVIIQEREISSDDSCSHNCDLTYPDLFVSHAKCLIFLNCQYLSSGYDICPSSNTSSRQYEWFKDRNGVVYGDSGNGNCLNKIKSVNSYYSTSKLRECDYCVCSCISNPFMNRSQTVTFSFRSQVSNIKNNMVVVGVRFVKKSGMVHLQIKEGRLYPNGLVSDSKWKELENIRAVNQTASFELVINETHSTKLLWGRDYGFMDEVNFDTVFAPEGFTITGARFGHVRDILEDFSIKGGPIRLEVQITRIDFIKGILSEHDTYWGSVIEKNEPREELIINDPDKPTRSPGNSIVSKSRRFMRFRNSDLKKDAGQSTIPFIDAQDVENLPNVPMGGMGLILRGRQDYGGFLAFRIYDLELHQYFNHDDHFN